MKRKTKAQREQAAKAALLQRVTDVYSGVWGGAVTEDDFSTAEDLSRIIPALKGIFGDKPEYLWLPHNLGNFDRPETATDFLYRNGVCA